MPSCCIKQCSARKSKKHPTLTLHRFPVKEILRQKWLALIGIENINPQHKMWYVCSLHFDETCFNKTLDVARLRDNALPEPSLLPSKSCSQDTPASNSIPNETIANNKPILQETQNKPSSICSEQLEMLDDEYDDYMNNDPLSTNSEDAEVTNSEDAEVTNSEDAEITNSDDAEIIKRLTKKCEFLTRKVRFLNAKVRRRNSKIALFSEIIKDLENKFVNKEDIIVVVVKPSQKTS